jgi:lactate dehydrogenase-like 2-hydroxyacid dehydrogenase
VSARTSKRPATRASSTLVDGCLTQRLLLAVRLCAVRVFSVDLEAASKRGMSVIEVTGCNVVSVAEHVVMQILALVRNYIPGN